MANSFAALEEDRFESCASLPLASCQGLSRTPAAGRLSCSTCWQRVTTCNDADTAFDYPVRGGLASSETESVANRY